MCQNRPCGIWHNIKESKQAFERFILILILPCNTQYAPNDPMRFDPNSKGQDLLLKASFLFYSVILNVQKLIPWDLTEHRKIKTCFWKPPSDLFLPRNISCANNDLVGFDPVSKDQNMFLKDLFRFWFYPVILNVQKYV